ncbi:flagellar assembly protein FliH [Nitrosomonas supralitoralis]|uniref:Flagellar assembly protein FliH n=1 Tax=Nitrosomonas supralitoralis TaxID=2116706 RepID=A0A2P7NYX1_9PROT|nr:flagellar assembly protein FliH [Nitrosomonas supralitoralis]PSJ18666.1 flagellar assembly protein FliH [Nitrosomonas supralitoralis]
MITNDFISKEKLNAYQRWEMDSLEDSDLLIKTQEPENSNIEDVQEKVTLPNEEEIAAIYQRAKETGYAVGLQQGHVAGYAEGREAAEIEVKVEAASLQSLLVKLSQDLQKMDQQVADSLLDLSIALARKLVTEALRLKPELIIPIVQEAIRNLSHSMLYPRLYLHPEDAKLVAAHFKEQAEQDSWSIREDEQLSRGGCRIEAEGGEIDGSMETRWHRALSTIGHNDKWLEMKD